MATIDSEHEPRYPLVPREHEPEFKYIELRGLGERIHRSLGFCQHANVVPVESLVGDLVARLCIDCDAQLPATWRP